MYLPSITYGSPAAVVAPDIPASPWQREAQVAGGYRESGTGLRVAYVVGATVRRVSLQLRFYEADADAVEAWALWAQVHSDVPFAFRFDASDPTTEYQAYLDSPAMGERIQFPRDKYLGALTFDVVLRLAQPGVTPSTPFPIAGDDGALAAGTLTVSPFDATMDDTAEADTLTVLPTTFTLDDGS